SVTSEFAESTESAESITSGVSLSKATATAISICIRATSLQSIKSFIAIATAAPAPWTYNASPAPSDVSRKRKSPSPESEQEVEIIEPIQASKKRKGKVAGKKSHGYTQEQETFIAKEIATPEVWEL
ncbi:hypothetical protein BGZ76_008320, partial [Entomortierella beljakovae]